MALIAKQNSTLLLTNLPPKEQSGSLIVKVVYLTISTSSTPPLGKTQSSLEIIKAAVLTSRANTSVKQFLVISKTFSNNALLEGV
jgi:hypothetical protein